VKSVALTGNIAAGKTQVAELFRRWGATVVEADRLVRQVQARGTPVFQAIVARFGAGMVGPDGELDRARLGRLVFEDAAARKDLEAIVHPAIEGLRDQLVLEARQRGDRVTVCDIPLLFESMNPEDFDAVVLVDAPPAVRLERLIRHRGMPEAEARRVMAAQLPAEAKRAWRGPGGRGPYVIENDGDVAELERRARAVWERLIADCG